MRVRDREREREKDGDMYSQVGRSASGLSWIWTLAPPCNYQQTSALCPKGREDHTRTHLNRCPLPPTGLRPSAYESCPTKGPSDNYTRQHDTRSRRLRVERAERERAGWGMEYFAGKVIWSNVWQWAVGLWNVPWLHLHVSLRHIWIFWAGAAVVMQSGLYKQPRKHHVTAVPQDAVQSIVKPQGATAN